eukprot:m.245027 g.245027  ORF g.245027 m.245027 type:complete len:700 (-) comp14586_c0_seq1:239-2338(-)
MSQFLGDSRTVNGFDDWITFSCWYNPSALVLVTSDGKLFALHCTSIEADPQLIEMASVGSSVLAVAATPTASRVCISTVAGVLHVFDVSVGEFGLEASAVLQHESDSAHGNQFAVIALSANGQRLTCPGLGASIIEWSVGPAHLSQLRTIEGISRPTVLQYNAPATRASSRPSSHSTASAGSGSLRSPASSTGLLAYGSEDGCVMVWRMDSSARRGDLAHRHGDAVACIAWSPCGTLLATGSRDHTVIIYDALARKTISHLHGATDWVSALAWDPRSHFLAVGAFQSDRRVCVWHVTSQVIVRTLTSHGGGITALAWSSTGEILLSASTDIAVRVTDMAIDAVPGDVSAPLIDGHDDNVRSVCWSPDGSTLVSGADDNTARVWNAATGELQLTLTGCTGWVNAVDFSPDGKIVACASGDGTVKLFNPDKGTPLAVLQHGDWVQTLAWSPNGADIATGTLSDQRAGVFLWDAATHQLRHRLDVPSGYVNTVSWSHDSTLLACGTDDAAIVVWDARTGQQHRKYSGATGSVRSIAFAPAGSRLACAWEASVRIFDTEEALVVATHVFEGHRSSVLCVVWSPAGDLLLSSAMDRSIRIWAVPSTMGQLAPQQGTPAFELDSPVYGLAWHATSGVCCACASGRIVQLGVVTGGRANQLTWNKSFRQTRKAARAAPAPLPPIDEDAELPKSSAAPTNSAVCAIL